MSIFRRLSRQSSNTSQNRHALVVKEHLTIESDEGGGEWVRRKPVIFAGELVGMTDGWVFLVQDGREWGIPRNLVSAMAMFDSEQELNDFRLDMDLARIQGGG